MVAASVLRGNLTEVSFVDNHATIGGAIDHVGSRFQGTSLNATNVLFAGNQATGDGAAAKVYLLDGSANFNHVTIADSTLNSKPAIYYVTSCGNVSGCGQATVQNSIIANHAVGFKVGETTPGEQTSPLNLDYLLFSGVTTPIDALMSIATGEHSLRGNADFVDPAQDNYELGAASQACDVAASEGCPAVDLNGAVRPQGLSCHIGAYEAVPASPVLAISPTAFSFIAMPGMGQPVAQNMSVSNIGVGTLNWSVAGNPSWISGSPTSGSQNGTVAVKVNHTGLAEGSYAGTLTLSSNALNPEVNASVQLEILDACIPLAANGGFEAGSDGKWQESSSSGNSLIRQAADMVELGTPHGGDFAVVLGSQNGDFNELGQDVKLPSGGALTLEYYYQIASNEENCTFDQVHILLGETEIAQHGLCPANNTSGWQKGSINLAPYANRTDRLRFTLQNDGLGSPSVFLLDDVTIVAAGATCVQPILQVTPSNLTFSATENEGNPPSQVVTIDNIGTGTLAWTAEKYQ